MKKYIIFLPLYVSIILHLSLRLPAEIKPFLSFIPLPQEIDPASIVSISLKKIEPRDITDGAVANIDKYRWSSPEYSLSSLKIKIEPGWHINSTEPLDKYLIPLKLYIPSPVQGDKKDIPFENLQGFKEKLSDLNPQCELETGLSSVTIDTIIYPEPVLKTLSFSPGPMSLYEGEIEIFIVLKIAEDYRPSSVPAALLYQACNDTQCLFPITKNFEIPIK